MPDAAVKMIKRSICVIAEDLSSPVDEGIKHFACSLVQGWSRDHRVLGLSVRSRGPITLPDTFPLKTNKFFMSYPLLSRIRRFNPEMICYVPSASATLFSFLRARMLKIYYPAARVVMVSLQPRRYGRIARRLIPALSPDVVFVQGEEVLKQLRGLGCQTGLLPSGVDINQFTPASKDKKKALRAAYGLDPEAYTVLHVGHITGGRGIELLAEVRRQQGAQVVLVGSSLVHKDRAAISARLREQGIVIIDKYLEHVEEIYQLADCYLFPVFSGRDCIGTPLSVLEAMACNLPVVTVRYGLLPQLFNEGQGLFFADAAEGLIQGISLARSMNGKCRTRENVAAYSWEKIGETILEQTGASEEKRS